VNRNNMDDTQDVELSGPIKGNIRKTKLMSLKQTVSTRILDMYWGIN
jgi:hypothetical protein